MVNNIVYNNKNKKEKFYNNRNHNNKEEERVKITETKRSSSESKQGQWIFFSSLLTISSSRFHLLIHFLCIINGLLILLNFFSMSFQFQISARFVVAEETEGRETESEFFSVVLLLPDLVLLLSFIIFLQKINKI